MKKTFLVFVIIFAMFNAFAEGAEAVVPEEKVEPPKYHTIFFKPKLSVSFIDNRNIPGTKIGRAHV